MGEFWEPIYFSSRISCAKRKIDCIWFSIRISGQKSFTEKFVENYIALARELIFTLFELGDTREKTSFGRLLQSISQIILESEQGEFFLKLVSDLPEKLFLIASESDAEKMKTHVFFGKALALVKCADCGVLEKSE